MKPTSKSDRFPKNVLLTTMGAVGRRSNKLKTESTHHSSGCKIKQPTTRQLFYF